MQYDIYKITNNLNNKIYIGKTKQFKVRKNQHIKGHTDSLVSRAIKKYGIDNFTFEIIDSTLTEDELSEKEYMYIKKFNSLTPNGYNILAYHNGECECSFRKRQMAHLNKRSKDFGVYKDQRFDKVYYFQIMFKGEMYRSSEVSMEKAKESYDKLAIFLYGDMDNLHFPYKINKYLKSDLEKFAYSILNKDKSSQFIGVCQKFGKWQSYVFIDKKMFSLGLYNSEEEAAESRDKVSLFLFPNRKLNFENKREVFLKENLELFYKKILTKKETSSNIKNISFNKASKKWVVSFHENKEKFYLGKFSSLDEAKKVLKDFKNRAK